MGLDSVDPSPGARDHVQVVWNERLVAEVRQSAQLWFREDCGLEVDWTSAALVNKSTESSQPETKWQKEVVKYSDRNGSKYKKGQETFICNTILRFLILCKTNIS